MYNFPFLDTIPKKPNRCLESIKGKIYVTKIKPQNTRVAAATANNIISKLCKIYIELATVNTNHHACETLVTNMLCNWQF